MSNKELLDQWTERHSSLLPLLHRNKCFSWVFEQMFVRRLLNEDVTQECWLAAYRQLHRYDATKGTLSTWLTYVAYRAVTRLLEKAKAIKARPLHTLWKEPLCWHKFDVPEPLDLSSLKPRHRRMIELRYLEDTPVTEIARVYGITPKRVDQLLMDARTLLRRKLNVVV